MASTRKYPRQAYGGNADIPVTVIQFGKLERIDLTVKGVDISDGGRACPTGPTHGTKGPTSGTG